MAEVIRMPKMSDTMTEGVISNWLKKVGDNVKSGDILAEVETDKATMELESYEEGVLLHVQVAAKQSVPVNGIIAIIGKKGEDITSLLGSSTQQSTEIKKEVEPSKAEKISTTFTPKGKAIMIPMPKMSDTMAEGTISQWLKKVGDNIKSGDILAEVETDKATMELESYEEGFLLYAVQAGKPVAVNGPIAVIGEKDADFEHLININNGNGSPKVELPTMVSSPLTEIKSIITVANSEHSERIFASPLAKKIANEKGIDLKNVTGSGDHGRITRRDVENYTSSQQQHVTSPASIKMTLGEERFEEISLSQMRKTIARRLSESMYTAPHFYLTMEINMDKAIEARNSLNEMTTTKISFNDIVVKATAVAIRKHPEVNVSWLGDKLRKNHHIHLGIAVAVAEGLLVPVIRFADQKSLGTLSSEIKELGQKAKDKKLQPSEMQGNTFTISNLGMFGIEDFTAIINPPDACILAVGGIKETVVVQNGQMKIGNVMKVTLSCDHRAVDGAIGAAFLKTLKSLLEDPIRILL